jgi:hypothetical protein
MAIDTNRCAFCGGMKNIEHSATSLYFAKVTKGARPWPVEVFHCADCGSRQLETSKNGILGFLRAAVNPFGLPRAFFDVSLPLFRRVGEAPPAPGFTQPRIFLSAR